MREILFRGKGTCGLNAGDWIYGYYVKDFWKPTRCGCGIIPIDKERGGYCEVDPSTIGQYTGLTDKNGKKIFEGDIIEICQSRVGKYKAVVYWGNEWEKSAFLLSYNNGSAWDYLKVLNDPFKNIKSYEIIGNIYDNTELLKED